MKKRKRVIELIQNSKVGNICEIIENDSGLHFWVRLKIELSEDEIKDRLLKNGIRMKALSDYMLTGEKVGDRLFIVNYSNLTVKQMEETLPLIEEIRFS
ncbi:MAG: hypothetical protein E7277_01555 [Lachnospiraceae bacterium]|nr:hypothetical protein [Lachnospiraceae bacterium]